MGQRTNLVSAFHLQIQEISQRSHLDIPEVVDTLPPRLNLHHHSTTTQPLSSQPVPATGELCLLLISGQSFCSQPRDSGFQPKQHSQLAGAYFPTPIVQGPRPLAHGGLPRRCHGPGVGLPQQRPRIPRRPLPGPRQPWLRPGPSTSRGRPGPRSAGFHRPRPQPRLAACNTRPRWAGRPHRAVPAGCRRFGAAEPPPGRDPPPPDWPAPRLAHTPEGLRRRKLPGPAVVRVRCANPRPAVAPGTIPRWSGPSPRCRRPGSPGGCSHNKILFFSRVPSISF